MQKQPKTSVIFMGTPLFALLPLQGLIEHPDFEVKAVVTQKDKKVGRKLKITAPPVKILAEKSNIPVLQPDKVSDPEFMKLLTELKPDFIVVVAFGQILPQKLLDIPKYDSVNIHASLLPRYRGASPIQEALLQGDKDTGVTIMKMSKMLDEGDIYLMKRIDIEPDDESEKLSGKLSMLGALMLPFVLPDIKEGKLTPIAQDPKKATYCTKIKKEDGLINFSKETAEEISNKIRAFSIWPNAYTFLDKKQFKIFQATISTEEAKPGEIVFLDKDTIGIGTKKGLLIPKEVQLEGKSRTPIEEFLKGYTGTLRKTKSFTSSK
ncbi:MAG: methionyl-tRNA formyltransferase [Patescibacteria group bacterium]|nr:methionyl-tRNA formyltransferase [Patescibacteria group bacterium]